MSLNVHQLITDPATRVIVTCGSGGVGKTTSAAALAVLAADAGRTVAVLTIDPAKRLAQSLGLRELDNVPRRVALDAPGELLAMMLDTRRTFDDMVSSHTSGKRAQQILANPFYQTISTSFSGTQEYMAMEKLSQLAASGAYDLIVVDTPPSRSALDFLDAPQRLSSFLDGRLIRLLASPGRGMMRVVGAGLTLMSKALSTIIGSQMLSDAATFVRLFEDLFGGFRQRAEQTYQLLRQPGTVFLVVATPQPAAVREATFFADRLRAERMPLAGLLLNQTHPLRANLGGMSAAALAMAVDQLAESAPLASGVLAVHLRQLQLADAEERAAARLAAAHPGLAIQQVPELTGDITDIAGLRRFAELIAK